MKRFAPFVDKPSGLSSPSALCNNGHSEDLGEEDAIKEEVFARAEERPRTAPDAAPVN